MSGSTSSTIGTTPVCAVGPTGLVVPTFQEDILPWVISNYQNIYGSDVYLGNDSPDGQWVSFLAACINDCNAMGASVYTQFSPVTAQGNGLSSVVKVNGITRNVASYSTAVLTISGVANRSITNGAVTDANGNTWNLPAVVTIGSGGTVEVTATCAVLGAISAAPGTITNIATPVRGWQTVTNAEAASEGAPVETDAALRVRQQESVALPSLGILDGLTGALAALPNVTAVRVYENATSATDQYGDPPSSINAVVTGGDLATIAQTVFLKKAPGTVTAGNTSQVVTDANGFTHVVYFSVAGTYQINVTVVISINGLTGYSSAIGGEVQSAVAAFISSLATGAKVGCGRVYVPANLMGPYAAPATPNDAATFEVQQLYLFTADQPTLGSTAGGDLAAATYYARYTFIFDDQEVNASSEASLAVDANELLTVAAPVNAPPSATGWNVYVSTATGTETRQNSAPIALTDAWTEPTGGLVAGVPIAPNQDVIPPFTDLPTCAVTDVAIVVVT